MDDDIATVPEPFRTELLAFEAAAEAVLTGYGQELERTPPPKFIYHYTTPCGLEGILETGTIRLSDAYKLNDTSEIRHGFSRCVHLLNERLSTGHEAERTFAIWMAEAYDKGIVEEVGRLFVGSFSSLKDDLSQWIGYADGAKGFHLSFEAAPLEQAFVPQGVAFPISYDAAKLDDLQGQLVQLVQPLLLRPIGAGFTRTALNDYFRFLHTRLTFFAMRAALFFKHDTFHAEAEYRFLEIRQWNAPTAGIRQRQRSGETIDFTEYGWALAAATTLREIMVGPGADFETASSLARQWLDRAGFVDVPVTRSRSPYRAL